MIKLRNFILTCLLVSVAFSFVYYIGFKKGYKEGEINMAKEMTKILIDVGHKMATNGLPQGRIVRP